ncbi:unnamed protein product [Phyllotreta striolata]|uniref:Lipase n=1 Tax=Phyllotreta striolata TaxID=444603 RepID=A0A9N9XLS0_PHYSR|nr:unnamed protein product [Phyllotreta striolata]
MMTSQVLVTLLLALLSHGTRAGFLDLPSDPLETIKSTIDSAKTGAEGIIGTVPELITDSLGNVLDINNVPVVARVPTPDLIAQNGYPVESHYVTTDDGYILNIHRIPKSKNGVSNGKVVYIQHGLMCSSVDFVLFGPKHGLAYLLSDAGYDVWLGNVRGNTYSRNHTRFSADDEEFWQFSWHEIGKYDIPAIIDYVLLKTQKEQLFHIGHSQGTTTFYVMLSEKPKYNDKVEAHISLAPIAFMGHLFSPLIRFVALGTEPLSQLLNMMGEYEFLPNSSFFTFLKEATCFRGIGKVLCKNALFAIAGFSPNQLNVSNVPVVVANYPAGASTRQIVHYGQEVKSKKFRMFDYGIYNVDHYTNGPPDYDLTRIETDMYLLYSSNDWLAAKVDVEHFYDQLLHSKVKYNIPIDTWNHLDYLFGNDAPKVVYKKVLEILSKYN